MSKYCPAGKIECSNHTEDVCVQGKKGNSCGYYTDMWEQCPWPSKQKPVKDRSIPYISTTKSVYIEEVIKKTNELVKRVNEITDDLKLKEEA